MRDYVSLHIYAIESRYGLQFRVNVATSAPTATSMVRTGRCRSSEIRGIFQVRLLSASRLANCVHSTYMSCQFHANGVLGRARFRRGTELERELLRTFVFPACELRPRSSTIARSIIKLRLERWKEKSGEGGGIMLNALDGRRDARITLSDSSAVEGNASPVRF